MITYPLDLIRNVKNIFHSTAYVRKDTFGDRKPELNRCAVIKIGKSPSDPLSRHRLLCGLLHRKAQVSGSEYVFPIVEVSGAQSTITYCADCFGEKMI